MEDKFLQLFLTSRVFDIGDDDDRLKWLQQSIEDLKAKLQGDYSLLPKHTMVALDPNISDVESVIIETETIITTYWRALRGKYTEMPRTLIRGVILNALNLLGMSDPVAARIIFLAATNYFPYAKLDSESKIVGELLQRLGNIAEKSANDEWSLIEEEPLLKLGPLKISKAEEPKVDDAKLKGALKTAAKHSPEGHHQYSHPEEWSEYFAKTATPAIVALVTGTLKALDTSTVEASINKFFSDFKKNLDENLKSSFLSLRAVERRSKLLWWKETLYSSSQKKSYYSVEQNMLPVIMAVDLFNQLPSVTPTSVDFLLRDTLVLLNDKKNATVKFGDFLTDIVSPGKREVLKEYFSDVVEEKGRISVTHFVGLLLVNKASVSDFKSQTGIDENEEISLSDLSVIILHDHLIQKLTLE